ncbi:MAG: hypothetical protein CVU34_15145 [Betaproteobacteria bacterium HGW-Betaproteobacteria-7]|jgi:hypothetical protein|nr:MAG: hypothetical protein CVU34_15145 [Betaproteobacteria bacterium HGW-Betaproteobacteria-7]
MSVYGLYPASHFVVTSGRCADCNSLPQALWYFRDETIAVPAPGMPLAGFTPELSLAADLAAWRRQTAIGADAAYPPLIWLGAPEVLRHAGLSADGSQLLGADRARETRLAPRLPLNRSWFDASSLDFFQGKRLKLRGWHEDGAFVARTFWPEAFALPEQAPALALAAEPAALRAWIRERPQGGAREPFSVESVWRRPGSNGVQPGQPVLGLMLNGAQGDDDEAHSGHFALMTGCVGEGGAIDDWLVNNFYSLDVESEKGILAAPVPLDNYLGDLNSGQAWYRPSWLLVATLRRPEAAIHLQAVFGRVYNQFYRHQFSYQHARANCTGISVTTARALGWQVPARGGESWLTAIFGLPLLALRDRSLAKGKAMFDYLTEDRTRLYPAVAFAEAGADLLRLVRGESERDLSDFERRLAEDIDEILLVRVPQFPSSRAWGDSPAENSVEYRARIPEDPAQRQIIPVPPRPFPAELRDPHSPKESPLRSDYAVAAWAIALIATLLLIL